MAISATLPRLMAVALVLAALAGAGPGLAQGNPLYTVSGIAVDVTDKDASRAKLKAISEAQVKAFAVLVERLAGEAGQAVLKRLSPADIGRMMASLSIEEERTGPGRYIGRLTVRFLPDKVRQALARAGVAYSEERAPPIVIVPVWQGPEGAVAWTDNPWRRAWLALNAQDALVPLIIPLGDLSDAQTLSPEDAIVGHTAKLEAVRLRYSGEAILVAIAAPTGEATVRAVMSGDSPLGFIDFDKTYTAEEGGVEAAAGQAARRFYAAMVAKWRESRGPARPAAAVQALSVAVPFASLEQWNAIRSRLLATPGVAGVDISNLTGGGAIVRLSYGVPLADLQAALAGRRLDLALVGDTWVLRPF